MACIYISALLRDRAVAGPCNSAQALTTLKGFIERWKEQSYQTILFRIDSEGQSFFFPSQKAKPNFSCCFQYIVLSMTDEKLHDALETAVMAAEYSIYVLEHDPLLDTGESHVRLDETPGS